MFFNRSHYKDIKFIELKDAKTGQAFPQNNDPFLFREIIFLSKF